MTARMKRCATFVTAVMALLLSACRMDGTVEVHADGSAETVFVFEDDDGPLDVARQLTDERGLARAQKSRHDENLHQTPLSLP